MATYVYQNEKGETIEREFPMGSSPRTLAGGFKRIISGTPTFIDKSGSFHGKGKAYEIDKWMHDNGENIRGIDDVKSGESKDGFTSWGTGAGNSRSFGPKS